MAALRCRCTQAGRFWGPPPQVTDPEADSVITGLLGRRTAQRRAIERGRSWGNGEGCDPADGAPAASFVESLWEGDGSGARHLFAAKREPGHRPVLQRHEPLKRLRSARARRAPLQFVRRIARPAERPFPRVLVRSRLRSRSRMRIRSRLRLRLRLRRRGPIPPKRRLPRLPVACHRRGCPDNPAAKRPSGCPAVCRVGRGEH